MDKNINKDIVAEKGLILFDDAGSRIGEFSLNAAIEHAEERGLDVVELSTDKEGMKICKAMDYPKFLYQQKKNQKSKPSKSLKQIDLKPQIEESDLRVKANNAIRLIEKGHPIKIKMMIKGARNRHSYESGREKVKQAIDLIAEKVDMDTSSIEIKNEGNIISANILPKKKA